MSHPFSSTFDALQAHFAQKADKPNSANSHPGSTIPPPPQTQPSSSSQIVPDAARYGRFSTGPSHMQNAYHPLPNTAAGTLRPQLSSNVPMPRSSYPAIQPYPPREIRPLPRKETPSMMYPHPSLHPNTANSQGWGVPLGSVSRDVPNPYPPPGAPRNERNLPQSQSSAGVSHSMPVNTAIQVMAVEDEADPMDSATDALLERQNHLNSENPMPKLRPMRGLIRKYLRADIKPDRPRGGHGGRGAKKRGPRKAAEPTGDIKYRLNMASNAYMDGRIDEAIEFVNDAIRINAETYRAWVLLASLRQEKGDREGHFHARLFAAHLQPKIIDEWLQCAELAIALREETPEQADEYLDNADKLYSRALRIDSKHSGARHGRAAVRFEMGHLKSAVKDYAVLVEQCPFDIYAIRSYAEIYVLLADTGNPRFADGPRKAIEAYRRCIAHFRENGFDPQYPFDWQDIKIFVELLAYIEQFKDAIHELRSLSRWLLTRSDETFWDSQGEDCEWDEDSTRRLEVEQYQDGKHPSSSYGKGLPLELRAKLAVYRLKVGQEDEAMRHLAFIDPDIFNTPELLLEHSHLMIDAASALYEAGRLPMALRFYEPLREPDLLDTESLIRAGQCYLDAGDKRQAEECFTTAIDQDEANSEACIDARYELAKMYEAAREEREAYILVNEAIKLQEAHDQAREEARGDEEDLGEDNDEGRASDDDTSLLETALGRVTGEDISANPKRVKRLLKPKGEKPKLKAKSRPKERKPRAQPDPSRRRRKVFGRTDEMQLEERRRADELSEAWKVVRDSRVSTEADANGPSNAFLSAARLLVDDFRSYKDFYSWDKYLAHLGINQAREKVEARKGNPNLLAMAERLSNNLNPEDSGAEKQVKVAVSYRGVSFAEWLDLFLEYAIGLAQVGRFQDAYQVCESARDTTIFSKSKEDVFLIHVTWAACALRSRDEETCVATARWLMREYQYDTDPFRMFSTLSRLCPSPASWYASGPVQKYMLRQIKLMDRAITAAAGAEDSGDEEGVPSGRVYPSKELDITLLMLYGHILFISNSFTYALNYFMRAYTLDPTNSMVILSVGHCYVHYALKRQAENRQFLLTQGFLFLHQYYELKVASPSAAQRQEAHYNLARSYHAIGIPHLAVEYYQRVLQDVPDDSGNGIMGRDDLSQEAAYNLQQIYWAGGDVGAIKGIGEKYLVL
ncbi:TPR-like protein [Daldinia vernicosa]|uniref:TPR-like protein n=1 Tax=Daldinia vernicosa TaxID=114800 RepID=UPI0020077EE5|nr:TPR-like protein [Daldinia vernicosa]KAI0851825.1 TPR-like protein [Daldinia vernicosa]